VVICLQAWQDAHLVIHMDSTFVLGLIKGGLLAMERDGWGDAPRHLSQSAPTKLLQCFLYLLRDRTGRLAFEKAIAHSSDIMNNRADALANKGRKSGHVLDLGGLALPQGWVDVAPVLYYQPLDYLTKLVVQKKNIPPLLMVKFRQFSDRWTVIIGNMFGHFLDPGAHVHCVWDVNIPKGLKEVLWKEMNSVLVIGH